MVIDMIMERKDGEPFDPEEFREYLREDERVWRDGYFTDSILDEPDPEERERLMKEALCRYIREEQYNEDIIPYIMSVGWTDGRRRHLYSESDTRAIARALEVLADPSGAGEGYDVDDDLMDAMKKIEEHLCDDGWELEERGDGNIAVCDTLCSE